MTAVAVRKVKERGKRPGQKKVAASLGLAIPAGLLTQRAKLSIAQIVASCPPDVQAHLFEGLTDDELRVLEYDWRFWARPNQLAPDGTWTKWLVLAGRGFGKTRMGAEWIIEKAQANPGCRIALVGRTAADVRDVMIEGESGILACSPPWFKPIYEPSKRRLTWPNGAVATAYSGDEPNLLRGPQQNFAWADETAAWRYDEAWSNLIFGLRLGIHPQVIVTTTPKPTPLIKDLVNDPQVVITKGKTTDNAANLAGNFLAEIERKYGGTRLGRQEMDGELLDDVKGALWTLNRIEASRLRGKDGEAPTLPDFQRVVVGVDPAVTSGEDSDLTGIIPVGVALCSCKGTPELHAFVLDDVSEKGSPNAWATAVIASYKSRQADLVVGEVNNGGDLVEFTLRTVDSAVSYKSVRASRGKAIRAEPVASLYEQGKVHHVGRFAELEDEMTTWVPGESKKSPDRMDALVWAITELLVDPEQTPAKPRVRTL